MQIRRPDVRTSVDLSIYGRGLDFDLLSRELRVTPSSTHRTGDTMRSGNPFPHDLWSLGSPLPRSEPLNSHLLWLKAVLVPHSDFIKLVKQSARVVVHCWVQADADEFEFSVSPEALSVFIEVGLPWGISAIIFGAGQPQQPFSGGFNE